MKKGKIGSIEEFLESHPDKWILIEVLEMNEEGHPTVGRLLAYTKSRDEIYTELRGSNLKDVAVFHTGSVPAPKTGVML
jgi:hypothetical protein